MQFDRISPYYDLIVRIVFGKAMNSAQKWFLSSIEKDSKILVLGGGTGSWLQDLLRANPGCAVLYIDASEEMLSYAARNASGDSRIRLVKGTECSIPEEERFDAVITYCFLDLFSEKELEEVIRKIDRSLEPAAQWLIVDFESEKWWHSAMAKIMYIFFRIVSGLRTSKLLPYHKLIAGLGFNEVGHARFYNGFIHARLLARTSSSGGQDG